MKILIWDFNGTIIDDGNLCLDIENTMLQKRGKRADFTMEEYRDLFCFPVKEYYKKIGYTFGKGDESFEELSVEFMELYNKGFHKVKLMTGFIDKIKEAKDLGYYNVIISASKQSMLIEQCETLKIKHYFDEILGIDNLLAGSKVEMAKNWLKNSNINSKDCKYIGDSLHDLEVARALNIDECYLISCGHQSHRVLSAEYDRVFENLTDIKLS
ncbi:MAG: HAD hydrolase-like protein [Erysipelotrichaceae bacterium]|nr:HAD hydrolase-like protein [Erysipelotrichaceae bacterium]